MGYLWQGKCNREQCRNDGSSCASLGYARFITQGTPAAIYNIGSENSLFHGTPLNGAYVGTKHAVYALTHSLREELPDFIDVSLICPGFVMSELGPEENMKHGMPTDEFIQKSMPQIKANEFFVVTHAYNMERIDNRGSNRRETTSNLLIDLFCGILMDDMGKI